MKHHTNHSTHKSLYDRHQDVPPNHYHQGVKKNLFQKYWHHTRVKVIKKELPISLGRILDVGCHGGYLTENLIKNIKYKKLYGVDISNESVKYAKKILPTGIFKTADIHNLPFKDNTFDTLFCFEVLEHIENPKKALKEINRVLKKEGYALILVPTDNILFQLIWKLWLIFNPVWDHTHIQSFKNDHLIKLSKKEHFRIKSIKRFNLNMLLLIKLQK